MIVHNLVVGDERKPNGTRTDYSGLDNIRTTISILNDCNAGEKETSGKYESVETQVIVNKVQKNAHQ